MHDEASLLLVTHVAIRRGRRDLQIDDQTAAGIAQWCRHFDRVTYCGIAENEESVASSTAWVDLANSAAGDRATLLALPNAYTPGRMLKAYRRVRGMLREEIGRHRHLCFTIGGLIGDWPALSAIEARRQRRRYAAWIDRVEPPITRNRLAGAPLPKRLAAAMLLPTAEAYTRHILRHSAVALLQGMDTFNHYAAAAPDPHCTYDTHTHAADRLSPDALAAKQARVRSGGPLSIVYVGRAAAMKGPMDWLATLERVHAAGGCFRATWLGDGPDLPAMAARVAEAGLSGVVALPGFEGRREVLMAALRDADMLLFCHKTPESARCLIEALVAGSPIVGYGTAYSQGLVAARGGGALTPQNDVAALADRVIALSRDRTALAALIGQAAASGALYDEDTLYARRAQLMRKG